MRDDFCAFILSHRRPDRVHTMRTLRRLGYTGKVFIVVDENDDKIEEYRQRFPENVITFSREESAKRVDGGDNFNTKGVVYARNECFDLAERVGCRFFIELDDDYVTFSYRLSDEFRYVRNNGTIFRLDDIFDAFVEFLENTCFVSVAMGQNGDYFGGQDAEKVSGASASRKAMNTFFCDTKKRFKFSGRINEDVVAYTYEQIRGAPFMTYYGVSVAQLPTQSNAGGLTELYLDLGTYVKSFYSVMYAPSCVKVCEMGLVEQRLHHEVSWKNAAPQIVPERFRKT